MDERRKEVARKKRIEAYHTNKEERRAKQKEYYEKNKHKITAKRRIGYRSQVDILFLKHDILTVNQPCMWFVEESWQLSVGQTAQGGHWQFNRFFDRLNHGLNHRPTHN